MRTAAVWIGFWLAGVVMVAVIGALIFALLQPVARALRVLTS